MSTVFDVIYSPKDQHFFQNSWGARQRWFFIFQNYKIITTCLPKEQLEDCFIITASYLNRKNKKIRRSSSQLVRRQNFLQKIFVKKHSKTKILPNSQGARQRGTGLHRIRYIFIALLFKLLNFRKWKWHVTDFLSFKHWLFNRKLIFTNTFCLSLSFS